MFRAIKLTDAIISGLVSEGRGSDRPTERVSVSLTRIAVTDVAESVDGSTSTPSTVTCDLTGAQIA